MGYRIGVYQPDMKPHVVGLLNRLLSEHPAYFAWKYEENPYTAAPLGTVAIHNGVVVGFRGYFACRFAVRGANDNVIVLMPSDTVVHPDHQRKGLSVAMGQLASREFASAGRLFFNTSCTRESLRGYQRLGYVPLAQRFYVTRASLCATIRHAWSSRLGARISRRIELGRFGGIEVTDQPKPAEMGALAGDHRPPEGKLMMCQDEGYFRWRFRNPQGNYVFCYASGAGKLDAYVVLGLSPNGLRGYILDYAGDCEAILALVAKLIETRQVDMLSIDAVAAEGAFLDGLKALGFKTRSLVRAMERRLHGELPLLVRPATEKYTDDDFLLEEVDVRNIENWVLKPVYSDSV